MKKIIAFIVAISLFCLAGCSGQSTTEPKTEATSYNHLRQVNLDDISEQTIPHEGLTEILPELKSWIVNSDLSGKEYLQWDQFEKVSQIREFKNQDLARDYTETTAFHVITTDMIVVCPRFFSIESGDQRVYSLMHELMHSLVGTGGSGVESSMNLFIEGITDYLTFVVLSGTDLEDYDLTYKNEIIVISWLASLYGTDTIVESICKGEILDFVDSQSGLGNGSKIHEDLATIDHSTDQEEVKAAILSEMEILVEISKNSPNADDTWRLLEQFRQSYAPYLN